MSTKFRAFPKRLGSKIIRKTNNLVQDTTLQIKSTFSIILRSVQLTPMVFYNKDKKGKKL